MQDKIVSAERFCKYLFQFMTALLINTVKGIFNGHSWWRDARGAKWDS